MFMTGGLFVLGLLSLGIALNWFRKAHQLDRFLAPLAKSVGEPDISGKTKYTNCGSHQWLMKNVIHGNYLKSAEGFRNFMMNRTLTGTLLLGMILGLIPVIAVYLLFQSYQLIGTSLILVVLSVFIILGPGDLEISEQLIQWQTEQQYTALDTGDLAYARISQKTMKNWIAKLSIIGVMCIVIAPWGESILPAFAFVISLFIGFVYANIFLPFSLYSMPLALMVFFTFIPLVLSLIIIGLRVAHKKTQTDSDDLKF